jgi:hypothetical protein
MRAHSTVRRTLLSRWINISFLSRHSAIVRGMGYGLIRYSLTGYPWSPINTYGKVILVCVICRSGGKLNDPASKWRKTLDLVHRPLTDTLSALWSDIHSYEFIFCIHYCWNVQGEVGFVIEKLRTGALWEPYMGHMFCGHLVRGTCFMGTLHGAHVLWAPDTGHMFYGYLIRGTYFMSTLHGAHILWAPDTRHMFCGHLIRGTCFVGTWYEAHVLWGPDTGHMLCGHLIRGT